MTESWLSLEDKKLLLRIARETVESLARGGKKPPLPSPLPPALSSHAGAFVSLHRRGQLRGCIGTFVGEGPLAATVQKMAEEAGWHDPRFSPLSGRELEDLEIEISVLSPLRRIKDFNEIEVGKHGIYITRGFHRGVLLPQVATEYGWDRETFLSHTCLKAGLPADAWKQGGLTVEIFTAEVFSEKDVESG